MEYPNIINLLDNTPNQQSIFRIKNQVQKNDDSIVNSQLKQSTSTNSQIKFRTSVLESSLYDYSDAYVLVKRTVTIPDSEIAANRKHAGKKTIFKNCAPLTDSISEISNTSIDNAKGIGVEMPMHNLIEYRNTYLKTSGTLQQYYRNKPAGNIIDFPADNSNSVLFEIKTSITNITGKAESDGTKKC